MLGRIVDDVVGNGHAADGDGQDAGVIDFDKVVSDEVVGAAAKFIDEQRAGNAECGDGGVG